MHDYTSGLNILRNWYNQCKDYGPRDYATTEAYEKHVASIESVRQSIEALEAKTDLLTTLQVALKACVGYVGPGHIDAHNEVVYALQAHGLIQASTNTDEIHPDAAAWRDELLAKAKAVA